MDKVYLYLSYIIMVFVCVFALLGSLKTHKLYKNAKALKWRDAHRVILIPLFTGILIGIILDFFILNSHDFVVKVIGELN